MSSYVPLTRRPAAPVPAAKAKRAQPVPRFGLDPHAQPGLHTNLPPSPTQAVAPAQPVLQTKLRVGEAHDPLEREADRIAEQVVSAGEPSPRTVLGNPGPSTVQRACAGCEADEETIQRTCSSCTEAREEDIIQPARRPFAPEGAWQVPARLAGQIEAQRHRGEPLPAAARSFFETRMGYDLSDVRIHNDSTASSLNRELGARAFTVRKDIFFRDSEFRPDQREGRKLIAHELVHVAQQTGPRHRTLGPAQGRNLLAHGPSPSSMPVVQRAPAARQQAQTARIRREIAQWYSLYRSEHCDKTCSIEQRRLEDAAYTQLMRTLKRARRDDASYQFFDFVGDANITSEYEILEAEKLWNASKDAFSDVLLSGFDNSRHVIKNSTKLTPVGHGGRIAADHKAPGVIHQDNRRAMDSFQRADVLVFSGHHYGDYVTHRKELQGQPEEIRRQTGIMTAWKADHWLDVRKIADTPENNRFPNVRLVMSTSCATLCREAVDEWRAVFPNAVVFGYRNKSPKLAGNVLDNFKLPPDLILEEDMLRVIQSWRAAIESSGKIFRKSPHSEPGYYEPTTGMIHYYTAGTWHAIDHADPANPRCSSQEDADIDDRGLRPARPPLPPTPARPGNVV